jgi:hypothetical protein
VIFIWCSLILVFACQNAVADAIASILITDDNNTDSLDISLSTMNGKTWNVIVTRDRYLGEDIPVIGLGVTDAAETLIDTLPNCYYRSEPRGPGRTTVAYIKRCSSDIVNLRGFIADADYVYIIGPDSSSPVGLGLTVFEPGARTNYSIPSEENGGLNSDIGGISASKQLVTRRSGVIFPSLEIYVDPEFVSLYGEDQYVDYVIEQLAFTNFAYAQSGIKQVNLIAIVRTDSVVGRNESPLHLLAEIRRLRTRTMQENSSDIAALLTGRDRSGYGYWGYAEIGGACELRINVNEGLPLNREMVANGVFVSFALLTLMQRGWTLLHEMGHTLGAEHVIGDYVMDGNIVLVAPLSAYTATCPAKIQFYQSCQYDPLTKMVTDFYNCP